MLNFLLTAPILIIKLHVLFVHAILLWILDLLVSSNHIFSPLLRLSWKTGIICWNAGISFSTVKSVLCYFTLFCFVGDACSSLPNHIYRKKERCPSCACSMTHQFVTAFGKFALLIMVLHHSCICTWLENWQLHRSNWNWWSPCMFDCSCQIWVKLLICVYITL